MQVLLQTAIITDMIAAVHTGPSGCTKADIPLHSISKFRAPAGPQTSWLKPH
jgi:hypothetical protein